MAHVKRKGGTAWRNRVFPKKLGFFAPFLNEAKAKERIIKIDGTKLL